LDIQSNAARLVLHGRNCSAVDSKQKTLLPYLCQKQAEVREAEDLLCNHMHDRSTRNLQSGRTMRNSGIMPARGGDVE